MQRFILRRILYALVSLFLLSLIIFFATRLTGDPARLIAGPDAREADLQALREELGLTRPLPTQYLVFVAKAVRGDFGISYQNRVPALGLYLERLPASAELGLAAFIISFIIALPIGLLSAVKVNSWWDTFGKLFALGGMSLPGFWVGLLLILVFSLTFRLLPVAGRGGLDNLILPAFALGWYFAAAHTRLIRSAMLDVLGSEYIKLARLKGLPELLVIAKHALKNALIPVVTLAGINLVLMVSAAVVVETVFAWPGIGQLLYQGITNRDFPVVQTVVIVTGAMMVWVNLTVDVLYAYIDPRIRYES